MNKILLFVLMIGLFSANAQIDRQQYDISIPAVETEKDSSDNITFQLKEEFPSPTSDYDLKLPEKKFSMIEQKDDFIDPATIYQKQLNKHLESIDPKDPEEELRRNGHKTDQFLGTFESSSGGPVNIIYRDHLYPDGDLIRVYVNGEVVKPVVVLLKSYSGLRITLAKGENRIDFLALNQGESGPNTAEFKVLDDKGKVISSNQWNLATGVKASIIINKTWEDTKLPPR